MPSSTGLRFLRPYLSKDIPITRKFIYIRFFNTTRCLADPDPRKVLGALKHTSIERKPFDVEINDDRAPIEARIKELEKGNALRYPRIQRLPHTLTVEEYRRQYGSMTYADKRSREVVSVCGMF